MAKTRSNNSTKTQAASRTKRKHLGANDGRSALQATKSASGAQPPITNEQIGQVAGEIWGVLSRNGGQTLAAIKKSVDAPNELVLAAVGWLAREDKLEFTASGRAVKIALR